MGDALKHKLLAVILPLIKEIVDKPEAVVINAQQGEHTLVLEVTVDKSDLGKLIGKEGRMAKSLRLIIFSIAAKAGRRAIMEIIE